LETKYVVKIVTGELRIGLREGLVLEAIAAAFDAPADAVRRAMMASGDAGAAAVAARAGALETIGVAYGVPIGFMLASPIVFGSEYRELATGEWIVEEKFDGIRAQLHKDGDRILIFTRTRSEVSQSYPEIASAARALPGSLILDGEIVAQRDGRVLPFRNLQARLRRKEISEALLDEVPVAFVCFDLLARDAEFLIDRPLEQRRELLAQTLEPSPQIAIASYDRLVGSDDAATLVNECFERARAAGHEGLVAKRVDSTYQPGRRGKAWLKLKRELSTLDAVVVAVEWGHGKRAKVLSDYTFAVRGDDGDLVAIGKAYSGLTDAEIERMTPWFLAHRLGAERQRPNARGSEIPVTPAIVIEVAFDVISESELHESGFALRFPRIARLREDKPVAEVDTLARVREIYAQMLQREGLEAPAPTPLD
jgi:DNA ligase-1